METIRFRFPSPPDIKEKVSVIKDVSPYVIGEKRLIQLFLSTGQVGPATLSIRRAMIKRKELLTCQIRMSDPLNHHSDPT